MRLGSDIDAALAADMASYQPGNGQWSGQAAAGGGERQGWARLGGRRLPAGGRRYECGISHERRLV